MRLRLPLAAGLVALALTACDPSTVDSTLGDGADPAGATCPVGTDDCVDTAAPTDGDDDALDEGAMIRDAEALLGTARGDLPSEVRIARIGDEHQPLTEDYVIGRITVELDVDDAGVWRVTSATVELTEGPHVVGEDS